MAFAAKETRSSERRPWGRVVGPKRIMTTDPSPSRAHTRPFHPALNQCLQMPSRRNGGFTVKGVKGAESALRDSNDRSISSTDHNCVIIVCIRWVNLATTHKSVDADMLSMNPQNSTIGVTARRTSFYRVIKIQDALQGPRACRSGVISTGRESHSSFAREPQQTPSKLPAEENVLALPPWWELSSLAEHMCLFHLLRVFRSWIFRGKSSKRGEHHEMRDGKDPG